MTSITRDTGGVRIETSQGPIFARAVVGADGSNSMVRRHMNVGGATQVCRLLKVLTAEDEQSQAFLNREILFDFTRVPEGIQGYYWEFPSFVNGKAFMNRGVLDARIRTDRPRCDLKEGLRDYMKDSGKALDDEEIMGAPVRWYDRDLPISEPHMMLAGDAAGAEPLFAEGITFAFMYGQLAAEQLHDSFSRDDLSFSSWGERVLKAPLGKQLHGRRAAADFLYARKKPTFFRITWPILQVVWGTLGKILFKEDAKLPPITSAFGAPKGD